MDILSTGKQIKRKRAILVLLIVFCTTIMAVLGGLRDRLHIDEVWTFGLSNNQDSPFYYDYCYGVGDTLLQSSADFDIHNDQNYKDYFFHWHTADFYREYLTVQEDERFDYANVFNNQTADTHPPLYYCVIHTICSLFPNTFSFQYGLIVNYVLYACSLLLLFLIAKELLKSDILAILSMLLWGLSRAGVTEVLFIRMYMMESTLVLCLVYANIKLIQNFKWSKVAVISLIHTAGFLTHYYFYIVAFFLTLFTCLYFLFQRQLSKMFGYGFAALGSVGISVAIFPSIIRHLTKGSWSSQIKSGLHLSNSLGEILLDFAQQVISYYSGVDSFGVVTIALNIGVLICILKPLVWFVRQYEKGRKSGEPEQVILGRITKQTKNFLLSFVHLSKNGLSYTFISVTSILMAGLMIVNLEPYMGEYTIRYLFIILPTLSIFLVCLLNKVITMTICRVWSKKSAEWFLVVCVIVLCFCSNVLQPQILLKRYLKSNDVSFDGKNVIVANVEPHRDHVFAYYFLNAEKVYPMDAIDSHLYDALSDLDANEPVICIFQSELASVKKASDVFMNIPGVSFRYLSSSYFSLEIDALYHVFEVTVENPAMLMEE